MVRRRGRGRQGSPGPGTRAGPPCGRRPRSGSGSRPPSPGCPRRRPPTGDASSSTPSSSGSRRTALQPGINRFEVPDLRLGELHDHGRAPSDTSTAVAAARFRARLAGEPAIEGGGRRGRSGRRTSPRSSPPAASPPAAAAAGRESDDVALGRGPPRRRDRASSSWPGCGRSEVSNLRPRRHAGRPVVRGPPRGAAVSLAARGRVRRRRGRRPARPRRPPCAGGGTPHLAEFRRSARACFRAPPEPAG